ncbi:uncharacterized protein LOC125673212 [Ostrea edulis]|uniref:uncharacterized protein LOC125673212 n=1 Tax=Ostrea edulis TaxID=37623 RepID=UPI0024AE9070|nr:uncharacterized protein LOC125673212 [Ostrea edulis]
MPCIPRYFLSILSTIYTVIYDRCRNCWQTLCSCVSACCPCLCEDNRENGQLLAHSTSDNRENGQLLAHSTSVIASYQQQLCRRILDSFSQIYLSSIRHSLNWDVLNTVNGKTIVICAKISRLQDDIQATLNHLNILGKPKIMLVVIHTCEPGVTPENFLRYLPDDRVTSFTNVIYSESMSACYNCLTNREAAADIKRFIK